MYRIKVKKLNGEYTTLIKYENKVMLIVNTASKCAFTGQLLALEELYQKYKDQGFVVLAFPCNQFGHQEPLNNHDIEIVYRGKYNVSFPIFAKVKVNGENECELFEELKLQQSGIINSSIKWNFTKFLIDKNGNVKKRYAPNVNPMNILEDIESALNASV